VFNGLDLKKVAELEIPCGICLKELVQERGKIHQWLFPMTQREKAKANYKKTRENYGLDACTRFFFVSISSITKNC